MRVLEGVQQRLRIYIDETDQWQGRPLYAVLVETLRKGGFAGATVTRGVMGFGAHSVVHTSAVLRLSTGLPVVVECIDTPEHIAAFLEQAEALVEDGLVTLDEVRVLKYAPRKW